MKKILMLLCGVLAWGCQAQKEEFAAGALEATLMNSAEKQEKFSDILLKHQGKTLVIEVWASWCSDCVKAMPKVKTLQAANPEVSFVFLSMDKTVEKWKQGIDKHELVGDHYMANDGMKGVFGQMIDLDWIPRYIIVDKTGKVVLYRAIETDFEKMSTILKTIH